MEFVEGESVEHLIKRSGRLEAKVALEIASQVAAGLAAVHKQKLVHRDIKPRNIMVSLKEGGAVTARSSTSGWRSLHPTRRLKDWQSSSRIVERSWRWTAWSRSKIREVHKRDGCVKLPSRRFCASLLPLIRGFA
jgi:serine/threonine protein kinase